MKFKSFADVLAQWQGGIDLKPGRPLVQDLTEAEVIAIFGYIPTAQSLPDGTLITCRKLREGMYRLIVRDVT